ncbi:PREDICTED: NADH dehydrogenase [ubiquinone] 1 alpha subcomplex subunit 13 [Nicrophorus vespilloides]|uniref:NADH dehydrogenase [ubiquinone] 1 alpha subcomplex subunit 13 n=1 Tax=Nicrophorus vespilloides TaxID=110193 RepID=A0ABM1MTP5_NICVS|nr:PREDICTED: NADH dehydrogenase [ubiquinone] 1 alpha subcomplex subunit 13 [Nicrophorus vespilloides]
MDVSAKMRQDMPPAGGYKPIPYKRIPAKTFFSGWALIGGYLGMTAGAAYVYYLNCKSVHYEEIENRSANFAVYPMLTAERDRAFLKQLIRNRDEEADLMKNVPGWEVGTWYGEPIYKTTKILPMPTMQEYYIHSNVNDLTKRAHLSLWS